MHLSSLSSPEKQELSVEIFHCCAFPNSTCSEFQPHPFFQHPRGVSCSRSPFVLREGINSREASDVHQSLSLVCSTPCPLPPEEIPPTRSATDSVQDWT